MSGVDLDLAAQWRVFVEGFGEAQMGNLRSTGIGAVAALMTATTAFAGEIDGTVNPVQASVSLSTGGSQPAASYTVTLTNTSNSGALNVARLVGTTSVTGGNAAAKAVFKSSTSPCTITNVDQTSIDCNVGGLTLGASKTFTVTFTAPTSGTNIAFAWQVVFDNGTPPGNSNGDAGTANTGLDPIDSNTVTSDVPKDVTVTFFTGTGVATEEDPWVTKVKAPSTSQASTASVVEEVAAITCAPDLLTCNTSTLTIPGISFCNAPDPNFVLSQCLEITLLRDASTISKGAKIDSARVYYRKLETDPFQEVLPCTNTDYGKLPQAGRPCEDRTQRLAFPKKNTQRTPVAAGFESDWRLVIYAVENGKYAQ
jgi:hypothetical protein